VSRRKIMMIHEHGVLAMAFDETIEEPTGMAG
jgi:hypothetical protein